MKKSTFQSQGTSDISFMKMSHTWEFRRMIFLSQWTVSVLIIEIIFVMTCHVMPRCLMSCYLMSNHTIPYHVNWFVISLQELMSGIIHTMTWKDFGVNWQENPRLLWIFYEDFRQMKLPFMMWVYFCNSFICHFNVLLLDWLSFLHLQFIA